MALVVAGRCKETSTTTGTGTFNLAGASTGFRTLVSGIGTGNTTHYVITDGTNYEVGLGTVTSGSPDTLSRDTVFYSSNANAKVNWGSGTKDVFTTLDGGAQNVRAAIAASTVRSYVTTLTTIVSVTASSFLDNTIPQITEGTEILTLAITPASTTSRLLIFGDVFGFNGTSGTAVLQLHQDATANALKAIAETVGSGFQKTIPIIHEMAAGTTSSTTFRLRLGVAGGATFNVNSTSGGGAVFGGVANTMLRIIELGP